MVTIEKENVKKAYANGSGEVKKVLDTLFPEVFLKKWVKIPQEQLEIRFGNHAGVGLDIHVSYKGGTICFIWFNGLNMASYPADSRFKVEKASGSYMENGKYMSGFDFFVLE